MIVRNKNIATDNEILFWHKKILEWRETDLEKSQFCAKEQLCSTRFSWFITRLFYKQLSHPEEHIRETEIAKSYIESKLVLQKFAKKYKLNYTVVQTAYLHLQYLDRLTKLLDKTPSEYVVPVPVKGVFTQEPLEMKELERSALPSFVQVPQRLSPQLQEPMPTEVVKPKNTVELMSAGVRMTIDHDLGTDKLIKILEFLQDL
jgi:hypothetical protein